MIAQPDIDDAVFFQEVQVLGGDKARRGVDEPVLER